MEPTASFGAWVRSRRRAADLTQAQLAEAVSCAVITIRKIEADERRPSAQIARLLADALRIESPDRERFVSVARAEQSPLRLTSGTDLDARWPDGLPAPVTRLVGREGIVAQIVDDTALLGGPARLVTFTGAPGVGKTRVAIAIASRVAQRVDVPVVFVGLEGVRDVEGFHDALAAAVAARMAGAVDTLSALRREPTLLVLDNFEQLVACASEVGELLSSCPELTCLTTSRVRLDLYGEHEVPIEPLTLPEASASIDPATVEQWPALDLFVRRARAAARSLVFGRTELALATRICRLTDGIPLAIELSAAQLRRQSLDDLCIELETSLGRLGAPARDRSERQQTMVDAVRWSYDLLEPDTQRLLRAIVLFPAGFTREGAVAAIGPDLAPLTVSDALGRLIDHGLVRAVPCYAPARFAAFEIVRSVVAELDPAASERAPDEARIRAHLAAVVADLGPQLRMGRSEAETVLLVDEHDNVAWLLRWAFAADGDAHLGARLVRDLHQFWQLQNLHTEGAAWAQRVLASDPDLPEAAGALLVLGMFAWARGDLDEAIPRLDAAVDAARAGGDEGTLAEALGLRGIIGFFFGDPGMQELLEESLALYERLDGAETGENIALIRLGTVALRSGDLGEAERRYRAALELARGNDSPWGIATSLSNLGELRGMTGDWEAALGLRLEGFEQMLRTGSPWYATTVLAGVGHALFGLGCPRAAGQCYGIVERVLADLHLPMFPFAAVAWEQGRSAVTAALGDDYATEVQRGWSIPMTVEAVAAVVADALGHDPSPLPPLPPQTPPQTPPQIPPQITENSANMPRL